MKDAVLAPLLVDAVLTPEPAAGYPALAVLAEKPHAAVEDLYTPGPIAHGRQRLAEDLKVCEPMAQTLGNEHSAAL